MLARRQRLRSTADFSTAVQLGRRTRQGSLIAYLLAGSADTDAVGAEAAGAEGRAVTEQLRPATAQAGLIVGKSVGNSVVRHQVSRRLREQLRPHMTRLGPGDKLVIRALPGAAASSSHQLHRDLSGALHRLLDPARRGHR